MMDIYSDSSFKPIITTDQQGVRILDPNPYGEIVPPEDLFIYISLIAKQKSKSVLTQTDTGYNVSTFKVNTIDLSNPQETTSISESTLFKSKPNLTTDWTEIGGHDTKNNLYKDYEGFGITNIDIKIQSQTAPQVVIDFIDVRGATLFEQGSCSPYGLFFNLPYPMFVLTVKGYFGRPVEYYLNLVKFNSKFNSDTGNMECRAEFIGYSFAFLSDTIMGYVAASQYLREDTYGPQTKLRKKYQEAVAWDNNDPDIAAINLLNFCDNTAVGQGRCYTIKDLQFNVENFDQYTVPKIANSPEFNELIELESLKNSYESYREDLDDLIRELEKKCPNSAKNSKAYTEASIPIRYEFTGPSSGELPTVVKELLDKDNGLLKRYFGNTNDKGIGSFGIDIGITKNKIVKKSPEEIRGDAYVEMLTTAKASELQADDADNPCPGCNKLYDKLRKENWHNILATQEATDAGTFYSNIFQFPQSNPSNEFIWFLDLGYIKKDIDREIGLLVGNTSGENEGIITKKRKELIANINDIVKDQLGFNPTIRNIFTILLCNTDAFMEILLQVAVEAEKHHQNRASEYGKYIQSQGDGTVGIQGSGNRNGDKVYPWPTYYKRQYRGIKNQGNPNSGQNQGTKEDYPGNDARFANWVEVRFVEDFIDAYLKYERDRKILNGEVEGLPGYDNYQPINPLESPAWHNGPIKYLDVVDQKGIYRIIGERLFITLDHSLFSPIRLNSVSENIPGIGDSDALFWTPLANKDPNNLSKNYGQIEAWNFLNVHGDESGIKVLNASLSESKENFIQNVINALNADGEDGGYGPNAVTVKTAKEIFESINAPQKNEFLNLIENFPSLSDNYGFALNDEYYVFNTSNSPYEGGILLSHPTLGDPNNKKVIHANPTKMDPNQLFILIDEDDPINDRKINIVPEDGDFNTAITTFGSDLQSKTQSISFNTPSFQDDGGPGFTVNDQKLFVFEDSRYYTSLGAFSEAEPNGTAWWKAKDCKEIPPSNMGLITYWDYSDLNETYGISLFRNLAIDGFSTYSNYYTDTSNDGDDFFPASAAPRGYDLADELFGDTTGESGGDEDGVSTNFVSTPLWLDNVNSFRTYGGGAIAAGEPLKTYKEATGKDFYIKKIKKDYDSKDIQNRNLAYLFLATLKSTPLIVRYTNNQGFLTYYNDVIDSSDGIPSAYTYSLKPFNTIAGVAKTHKAWLLTLGSILWRWKMFVGTRGENGTYWNNPISGDDIPNGFDPLSQPGWDGTTFGGDFSERQCRTCYLDRVYNTNGNAWNLQDSSFPATDYLRKGSANGAGYMLRAGGGGENTSYVYFPYYHYLNREDKLGNVRTNDNRSLTNILTDNFETIGQLKTRYSWPMLWLAPHHIPFVNPEKFGKWRIASGNNAEGTLYVQPFFNGIGYLDYQTMMNSTRNGNTYSEVESGYNFSYTFRKPEYDGNLGSVIQNIPEAIKEEILEYFDSWCESTWPNLLKTVDPVNFSDSFKFFGTGAHYFNGNEASETQYLWTLNGQSNDTAQIAFDPSNNSVQSLRNKLFAEKVNIYNSTPKIWYAIPSALQAPAGSGISVGTWDVNESPNFLVSKKNFELYLGNFWETFRKNKPKKIEEINKKTTEEESGLAGSLIDDDDIKLSLYRTFKSLTDKWISSTEDGKSFFNVTDNGRGCNKNKDGKVKNLAAHFQYVNRVMADIGDIAMINLSKVRDLKKNVKISLYQWLSDILTENEYMFFPLPGYVDFTSQGIGKEDLEDMFRPVLSLKGLSCGPVFLCMYVGGNSRQLKYKINASCPKDYEDLAQFEDDGFWVSNTDANGGNQNVPNEIGSPLNTGRENTGGYTAFKIVYGQENQNHFKNIQLDQAEFSETAESLLVIDKLSQQGGTDQTSKGQNLNSVYLTRSYTCQVESFGNMMIQPMTYFDLMGVPMFNGAYLITTVEHNFKPNHATTKFKGVRQPRTTVPIVTDAAIAMDLSFKDAKTDGTGDSITEINKNPGASRGGGAGGGSGDIKTNGTSTEIYGNDEFQQTVVKDEPVKTPPTLNEILNVMSKKKGVFNSNKNPMGGRLTAVRETIINNGGYEPNKSYIIYTDPYVVNIVGIRNFVQTPNAFDDYLAVFYKDPTCASCKDNWQFKIWSITTDPGVTAGALVDASSNGLGSGFIAEGQFIGSHVTGIHYTYSALHNTRPILVYRDDDKDTWAEKNIKDLHVDTPGMNIHASGTYDNTTKVNAVNGWSAGCQVFRSPKDYMEFLDIILTKAKNTDTGKSTIIKINNKAGCNSCNSTLADFKPNGSTLQDGQSTPIRSFTYTLLNTVDFGKPSGVKVGDPVYENYIPGGARAGTAGTGGVDNNQKVLGDTPTTAKSYILNKSKWKKTGLGIVMAATVEKEGWSSKPGGAAYPNNNPGNLVYDDKYKSIDPKLTKSECCGGKYTKFSSDFLGLEALASYINTKAKETNPSTAAKQICNKENFTDAKGNFYDNQKLATTRTPKCGGIQSGVPNPSIYEYFYVYAPPQDNNNPLKYAQGVVDNLNSFGISATLKTPLAPLVSQAV